MAIKKWTGIESRALREARRMTLDEFARRLGLGQRTVEGWESRGARARPYPGNQLRLDQLLDDATEAERQRFYEALGLPDELAESLSEPGRTVESVALERELSSLEDVRRASELAMLSGRTPPDEVEQLLNEIATAAVDCVHRPSNEMLVELTRLYSKTFSLVHSSQNGSILAALHEALGRSAALIADEFTVLGDISSARAWHGTAWLAADRSGNGQLRADVRALAIILPLYYGSSAEMVTFANDAEEIKQGGGGLHSALAPALKAVALARIGDPREAVAALQHARVRFGQLADDAKADSVFGFSERRFRFYEGKALSLLGRTDEAWEVHEQALALYPPGVVSDPALIRMDRAASLIRGEHMEEGCRVATGALEKVPVGRRSQLLLDSARQVQMAVPAKSRTHPDVRALTDAIRSFAPARSA